MPIQFADRRNRVASCEDDELAVVKAAAWAWYQHSSGNEGKPTTRESDLAKSPREPRPSRYRLEASAAAAFDDDDRFTVASSEPQSPAHEEISLLDRYEIDRITRHLDGLILSTRAAAARGGGESHRGHGPAAAPRGGLGNGGKRQAKTGVFWVRRAVGLCGARADVADGAVLIGGARRPRAGFGR